MILVNPRNYECRIRVYDGDREIECDLYKMDNGGYFAYSRAIDGPRGQVMINPRTKRIEFFERPNDVRPHKLRRIA